MRKIRIPCSPEQCEVIADHFFENKELGMVSDERQWMLIKLRATYPFAKIKGADLDVEKGEWVLDTDIPE